VKVQPAAGSNLAIGSGPAQAAAGANNADPAMSAPVAPRLQLMKLSVRLLILVLGAALPVLALQVHGLLVDREQRKAAIAAQALELAHLAAAQQNQFIEGARYLLGAAAKLPEVQNRDVDRCNARMAEFMELFPTIAGIGAVGPDGVQFCSALKVPPEQAVSVADRSYFQAALHEKRLAISGYIVGRLTGKPRLAIAYPALDDAGQVRAVVALGFDLGRLSDSLLSAPLPAGATMSLIDDRGTLLARTPPAAELIGREIREAPIVEPMLARREGTQEAVGLDGVERMYGFAPLLASADLFAVVGLPWATQLAEADRLFWREAGLTMLAFLLASVAALLCAEIWIRRPLVALEGAVERMERGDLDARARVEPGSSPELRRLAGSFNDMAGSLQARQIAVQASEARLRAIVETAADGIITINQRGIIEFVNPEAEHLFGYSRDELIGQNVSLLMPSPHREQHDRYLARYLRTGEARIIGIGREVTGRRKDGTEIPLFLSIGQFSLGGERLFTGILRDVTERKRADERQLLMTAEIDHRAKNLLASIQAMVLLTKARAGSVPDYADTLVGRLHAMARAHELLARERWQGAHLHELIRNEFEAYLGKDGAALTITGEDRLLGARAAQTLSLVLHELTTNAAKYGALSMPGGRVTICSSIERTAAGEALILTWTESGGPVIAPPDHRGFGSVVIERGIAHDLGGSTSLEFDPAGLRCQIRFPLD
jgi:PAS domain S-box-containing protein